MFSFTKRPETTFKLLDKEYRINLAFNVVIEAFGVLDSDLDDAEKINKCFDLLVVDSIPSDDIAIKADIIKSLFEYINEKPYGNDESDYNNESQVDEPLSSQADYDYEQDAGAIYASFLNFYHIDLNQMIDRMDWHQFKALFDNLGSDTPIQKIRQYRSDDLTGYKENPEQAQFVSEMKSYYQLDNQVEGDGFTGNASAIFDMMMGDAE